jgi:Rod binding domain-containing protein
MTTHAIHFANRHTGKPAQSHHDELVKQSQKWVSQTFFGSMLKEMRKSPFKSQLFSGGRGGEAFSEMFDQQLADHMGKGSGKKLVNSLVDHMERAETARKARAAAAKKAPPIAAALRAYSQNVVKGGAK